jgi:hypothetical protein
VAQAFQPGPAQAEACGYQNIFSLVPKLQLGNANFSPSSAWGPFTIIPNYADIIPKQEIGTNTGSQAGAGEPEINQWPPRLPTLNLELGTLNSPTQPVKKGLPPPV